MSALKTALEVLDFARRASSAIEGLTADAKQVAALVQRVVAGTVSAATGHVELSEILAGSKAGQAAVKSEAAARDKAADDELTERFPKVP